MVRGQSKELLAHQISTLQAAIQERDAIILGLRKELAEAKAPVKEKKKETFGNRSFEEK